MRRDNAADLPTVDTPPDLTVIRMLTLNRTRVPYTKARVYRYLVVSKTR